ncbi:MAG: bifunctional phosphoribosyl-AMP cyclohydrolase/phosphoribosyl-ATP diphosphatase HisIE [Candidatus Calescibacterium sp.]|jgi:phosphoribosyl-ATP pyrophosphohydrolase/phosphoribosyl-AMP cyclohydrolase
MEKQTKRIDFSKGLIPTVAVDRATGKILMLAFSSPESLKLTFEKKLAHFFSRERNKIWLKGEESGNTMRVSRVFSDCDSDSLIFLVEPSGPACHTGEKSCFFDEVESFDGQNIYVFEKKENPFYGILSELEEILKERKKMVSDGSKLEESYSAQLFIKGIPKITEKIKEEVEELIKASLDGKKGKVGEKNSVIWECADVVFHILVLLVELGISFDDVLQELLRRRKEREK